MATKFNLEYLTFLLIAVLLSCIFHEFAHWVAGELLGNAMSMSLNRASPVSGEYVNKWNANIVTVAGPAFTIVQAILFYFIANKLDNVNAYPFLFFPFVYRFFAGLANMLSPNDEGRFGMSLGVGLYTVSILVCSFLLFLVVRFSIKNKIGIKFNLLTFFLCSLSLLLIVFVDQYFQVRIIR